MKAELKHLQHLLARRDWTAVELAKELKVSLPTVYHRLNELAEYTVILKRKVPRPATTGPVPKRYCLARSAGS
jgi:predicted transcriptional regulator